MKPTSLPNEGERGEEAPTAAPSITRGEEARVESEEEEAHYLRPTTPTGRRRDV